MERHHAPMQQWTFEEAPYVQSEKVHNERHILYSRARLREEEKSTITASLGTQHREDNKIHFHTNNSTLTLTAVYYSNHINSCDILPEKKKGINQETQMSFVPFQEQSMEICITQLLGLQHFTLTQCKCTWFSKRRTGNSLHFYKSTK